MAAGAQAGVKEVERALEVTAQTLDEALKDKWDTLRQVPCDVNHIHACLTALESASEPTEAKHYGRLFFVFLMLICCFHTDYHSAEVKKSNLLTRGARCLSTVAFEEDWTKHPALRHEQIVEHLLSWLPTCTVVEHSLCADGPLSSSSSSSSSSSVPPAPAPAAAASASAAPAAAASASNLDLTVPETYSFVWSVGTAQPYGPPINIICKPNTCALFQEHGFKLTALPSYTESFATFLQLPHSPILMSGTGYLQALGLEAKMSTIPGAGTGLFAKQNIVKGMLLFYAFVFCLLILAAVVQEQSLDGPL